MLFSKRRKLAKEYREWLIKEGSNLKVSIKDCPENVMAFLDFKGLLKE
jgi:hypothetical protein